MGYQDKVDESLEVTTTLGLQAALDRARQTIEDIGSVRTWRLRVVGESDSAFEVAIKPTVIGALGDPTCFVVSATQENGHVKLHAGISSYSVYQDKLLWVIPTGPKTVPGMSAYKRCLDALGDAFS